MHYHHLLSEQLLTGLLTFSVESKNIEKAIFYLAKSNFDFPSFLLINAMEFLLLFLPSSDSRPMDGVLFGIVRLGLHKLRGFVMFHILAGCIVS